MPNPCAPGPAMPASPNHAEPLPALTRLAYPALPNPCPPNPCQPCPAPARPACPALPSRTKPCLALPANPRRAVPCLTSPSPAEPAVAKRKGGHKGPPDLTYYFNASVMARETTDHLSPAAMIPATSLYVLILSLRFPASPFNRLRRFSARSGVAKISVVNE